MKLSEIAAELKTLKDTIANFIGDKTKATSEALTAFSQKLTALETGTTAELTQKSADLLTATQSLAAANATLEKAQSELTAIGAAIKTAAGSLKIDLKEGATHAANVEAIASGVTSTLAKLQVDPAKVPNAPPTKASGEPANGKKKSMDEEIRERQATVTATK